jgi:apolipoprotein N-acyltransferase
MHVLFASCWTLAELARAQWFTGFPWSAIGYAHVNSLLSYAAPWVGVYGIGFIAAFVSSWIAIQILTPEKSTFLKIKIAVVLLLISFPAIRQEDELGKVLKVNLLQANISQTTKFNSGRQQALDWYAKELQKTQAEITVLPEIAIPYFENELPAGYWDALTGKFKDEKQVALLGIPTLDKDKGYGNSAVGLGFGVERQYDKYHLVPFGEFTPESMKWFTRLMVNDMGDFNKGAVKQPPFIWQGHNFSMTICYEDLFGEDLAIRFVDTDQIPTVFVNISNIAWFGDSMVVNQHLDIARMRSLEFERPTIRATNTGGTAIISAEGRIVQQLPSFVRGNLQGQVLSKNSGITPFAYWAGHWGLMPLWLICLFIMGLALYLKSRTDKLNQHL